MPMGMAGDTHHGKRHDHVLSTFSQRKVPAVRKLIRIGLNFVVYVPSLVFAASTAQPLSERAILDECSALSQAAMRTCLEDRASESTNALEKAEADLSGALAKWDEDETCVNSARERFLMSRREFSKYRDTQCGFSESIGGGSAGNAREIRRLACVALLNIDRANLLRDAITDLSGR